MEIEDFSRKAEGMATIFYIIQINYFQCFELEPVSMIETENDHSLARKKSLIDSKDIPVKNLESRQLQRKGLGHRD